MLNCHVAELHVAEIGTLALLRFAEISSAVGLMNKENRGC